MHFNSQPHKEADISGLTSSTSGTYFNSQPHKEADITCNVLAGSRMYFNSQPHKEADDIITANLNLLTAFQFTASQGG